MFYLGEGLKKKKIILTTAEGPSGIGCLGPQTTMSATACTPCGGESWPDQIHGINRKIYFKLQSKKLKITHMHENRDKNMNKMLQKVILSVKAADHNKFLHWLAPKVKKRALGLSHEAGTG